MSDQFFNVHTIERPKGLDYGFFKMVQFNEFAVPDFNERRDQAMELAESLASEGKPVVVRAGYPGTRLNSLIWQSFNSADNKGLLEQ